MTDRKRLAQVAVELGVNPATVAAWVREGVTIGGRRVFLAAERLGGLWWTTPAAVEDFRRACNPAPASAAGPTGGRDRDRRAAAKRAVHRKIGGAS